MRNRFKLGLVPCCRRINSRQLAALLSRKIYIVRRQVYVLLPGFHSAAAHLFFRLLLAHCRILSPLFCFAV